MALEIKETPILRGKDAKNFKKALKENEHKKVSVQEYVCAQKAYKSITIPTDI